MIAGYLDTLRASNRNARLVLMISVIMGFTIDGGIYSAILNLYILRLNFGPEFVGQISSAANLIFALGVFTIGFRLGWPDRVTVAEVVPNSPAASAGLQAGDILLSAEGEDLHYSQQVTGRVYSHLGQAIAFEVQRAGQTLTIAVTPRTTWPEGEGPMGIVMGRAMVTDYSWPEAVARAGREISFQFEELIHLPARLASGAIPLSAARPIGIVGMNDLTRAAVETSVEISQWFPILQLIGLISVALAMTNLLPLPALDGGRILFVLIEAIRGRRIDPARESLVHMVGMLVLLALMAVITYQDIINPILPR